MKTLPSNCVELVGTHHRIVYLPEKLELWLRANGLVVRAHPVPTHKKPGTRLRPWHASVWDKEKGCRVWCGKKSSPTKLRGSGNTAEEAIEQIRQGLNWLANFDPVLYLRSVSCSKEYNAETLTIEQESTCRELADQL